MPSKALPPPYYHELIKQSYLCNWYGGHDIANAVAYPGHSTFATKSLGPYKVNSKEKGSFKTEGNLSFLRVYEAGHEVMYYRK